MNAFSLGLVKGKIDEVSQTVNITWIQPRVLGSDQIQVIISQIDDWTHRLVIICVVANSCQHYIVSFSRVKNAAINVEDQAAELFV